MRSEPLIFVRMCVLLSVYLSSITRERRNGFSQKSILASFTKNVSLLSDFGLKWTKITGTVYKDLHVFLQAEVTE